MALSLSFPIQINFADRGVPTPMKPADTLHCHRMVIDIAEILDYFMNLEDRMFLKKGLEGNIVSSTKYAERD